jgi:hypothetical protein
VRGALAVEVDLDLGERARLRARQDRDGLSVGVQHDRSRAGDGRRAEGELSGVRRPCGDEGDDGGEQDLLHVDSFGAYSGRLGAWQ